MPNSSLTFISREINPEISFEDIIILIIYADEILKSIRDLRLKCILKLKVKGYTNDEISRKLRISRRAVYKKIDKFEKNFDNWFTN